MPFFPFIFALTFHKCQFVKKAFLFIFIFWLFFKWGLFGVFFFPVLFGVFCGVRAGLRNLFFLLCFSCPFLVLGAGRRAAFFSVRLFVCVFSSFCAFFGPFLALCAGRRAALLSVWLFGCVFVCVFSSF